MSSSAPPKTGISLSIRPWPTHNAEWCPTLSLLIGFLPGLTPRPGAVTSVFSKSR